MRGVLFLFLGHAAVALVPIAPSSYAWLKGTTQEFLVSCQLKGKNGTTIFTPDGSSSYGAQWTRDFTMALTNAGRANFPTNFSMADSVAYTLSRVTREGMVPDRVQANGQAVFAPCTPGCWPITLAWDNMPYAALLLAQYARQWEDAAFFCKWESVARAALDFVPLRSGLAFNDPASPNTSFGFEDSVIVPGRQLTVSLLLFDAAQQMAALARSTGCGDAAHYAALAATVAGAVDTLFDAASGLFLASDTVELVPDVFGSSLVVALNLSTQERRAGVASWLAAQWAATPPMRTPQVTSTIFQQGQVRHLPYPLYWKSCWNNRCPAEGTYQNGAFWATPLNWVLAALEAGGFRSEAAGIAVEVVLSFQKGGVMECINQDLGYHGVKDYVASATNFLGVVAPLAE
jgi:hypothetical protein